MTCYGLHKTSQSAERSNLLSECPPSLYCSASPDRTLHANELPYRYFSTSSSLSLSAWSDGDTLTKCGHCDNCTRSATSISTRDVTLESWQIIKVLEQVGRDGGRITVGMLADLVRGVGGGSYAAAAGGKKGKGKEKVSLDLNELAGGKITMNKNVRLAHCLVLD